MSIATPDGMEIRAEIKPGYEQILTPEALALVAKLSRAFEPRRQELLAPASSAPSAWMPVSVPTSCRKPPTSATATGRSPRFRRRWNAAVWRSPVRSSARW